MNNLMGDVGKGIRNRKTNYAATYMVRLKVNEAQINLVLKKIIIQRREKAKLIAEWELWDSTTDWMSRAEE